MWQYSADSDQHFQPNPAVMSRPYDFPFNTTWPISFAVQMWLMISLSLAPSTAPSFANQPIMFKYSSTRLLNYTKIDILLLQTYDVMHLHIIWLGFYRHFYISLDLSQIKFTCSARKCFIITRRNNMFSIDNSLAMSRDMNVNWNLRCWRQGLWHTRLIRYDNSKMSEMFSQTIYFRCLWFDEPLCLASISVAICSRDHFTRSFVWF